MIRKQLCFAALIILTPVFLAAQPNLTWATQFGGNGYDYGNGIGVDAAENIYICGQFDGTCDFDPGPGVYNLTATGSNCGFISKLDPSGNFLWAHPLGGTTGNNSGRDLVVTPGGNVYVTGYFHGSGDFDPGVGVTTLTASGDDAFACKLDPLGNLVWAKSIGGTSNEMGFTLALDASENCFIGGVFSNTVDFDPGAGTFTMTAAGNDAFICELNSSGNFVRAIKLGGTYDDRCYGLVTDNAGNVYAAGMFSDVADFDPGAGIFRDTSNGLWDAYICKLTPTLDFTWVKCFGGTGQDYCVNIILDATNSVICTGDFQYSMDSDPGPGTSTLTSNGIWDIFAVKLTNSGSFSWSARFGGVSGDYSCAVGTDLANRVYLVGTFQGIVDFDPGAGSHIIASAGNYDAYLCILDSSGALECAGAMGGAALDHCNAIAILGDGKMYLTGPHTSGDFDPGTGTYTMNSVGLTDTYVLKLDGCASVGIDEAPAASGLNLFPNPVHGQLQIAVSSTETEEISNVEVINGASIAGVYAGPDRTSSRNLFCPGCSEFRRK